MGTNLSPANRADAQGRFKGREMRHVFEGRHFQREAATPVRPALLTLGQRLRAWFSICTEGPRSLGPRGVGQAVFAQPTALVFTPAPAQSRSGGDLFRQFGHHFVHGLASGLQVIAGTRGLGGKFLNFRGQFGQLDRIGRGHFLQLGGKVSRFLHGFFVGAALFASSGKKTNSGNGDKIQCDTHGNPQWLGVVDNAIRIDPHPERVKVRDTRPCDRILRDLWAMAKSRQRRVNRDHFPLP